MFYLLFFFFPYKILFNYFEYVDSKIIIKGMFGNCFFPLFFVFKNNFQFVRLKNLFNNSKWAENKNYFQNLICEGN